MYGSTLQSLENFFTHLDEDDDKILLTANGGAFLPADEAAGAFNTELDLEAELRMGGGCLEDANNSSTTRLPPRYVCVFLYCVFV